MQKEITKKSLNKNSHRASAVDHVRDAIYHEEDNNDMMKVVAMLKIPAGISPAEKLFENHNKTKK